MYTLSFKRTVAILAIAGTMLAGCSVEFNSNGGNTIIGSGKSVTENRPVSGINAVTLASSGQLTVEYGETESLTVSADDNILPLLTSDVSNGELTLGTKPNSSYSTRTRIIYHLTIKNLNAIESAGSGDVNMTGVRGEQLTVGITGSGSMQAMGAINSQDVTVSGSGSYNADSLDSQTASVNVSGSGSAAVKVSDTLHANVSGSGSVTYSGDPKTVDKQVTGSGSVNKR